MPTAGSPSSVRIIACGESGIPSYACPGAVTGVSPAFQADLRDVAMELAREALAPKPLGDLPDGTMLAVAPVPGKFLEEWRHTAMGVWIAHPHAADAIHAEEMTAAQLRDLLTGRDAG